MMSQEELLLMGLGMLCAGMAVLLVVLRLYFGPSKLKKCDEMPQKKSLPMALAILCLGMVVLLVVLRLYFDPSKFKMSQEALILLMVAQVSLIMGFILAYCLIDDRRIRKEYEKKKCQ